MPRGNTCARVRYHKKCGKPQFFRTAIGLSPCDLTEQTTTYGNILAYNPFKVKKKISRIMHSRTARARLQISEQRTRQPHRLCKIQHFFRCPHPRLATAVNLIYPLPFKLPPFAACRLQLFGTFRAPQPSTFQRVNLIYPKRMLATVCDTIDPGFFRSFFLCSMHNFGNVFSTPTFPFSAPHFNTIFTFRRFFSSLEPLPLFSPFPRQKDRRQKSAVSVVLWQMLSNAVAKAYFRKENVEKGAREMISRKKGVEPCEVRALAARCILHTPCTDRPAPRTFPTVQSISPVFLFREKLFYSDLCASLLSSAFYQSNSKNRRHMSLYDTTFFIKYFLSYDGRHFLYLVSIFS